MSTSPIGTRVPTLSPNSIIRAGIPQSDNFNATDVAISVESLLALVPPSGGGVQSVTGTAVDNTDPVNPVINSVVESGTWTPTFDSGTPGMSNVTSVSAYYSAIANIVTCSIRLSCDLDFSTFTDGSVQITNAPIATTTLSMIGCGSIRSDIQANVVVYDDIIRIYSGSGDEASVEMTINYQYEIN
jgi:hypothetical protein